MKFINLNDISLTYDKTIKSHLVAYLADYFLNLTMHLFLLILNLQLLIFCTVDLEYMVTLIYALFYFFGIIIKINHLYLVSISLSHTLKTFFPYGYVVILSNVCNLLLKSLIISAKCNLIDFFSTYTMYFTFKYLL